MTYKHKPPRLARGFLLPGLSRDLFLGFFGLLFVGLEKARELLLEARHAAAAVEQMLLAAGPGRMGLRIDVEMHDIALLAPSGTGGEFAAIGHHNLDGVVVGVDIGLHGASSVGGARARRNGLNLAGLYR